MADGGFLNWDRKVSAFITHCHGTITCYHIANYYSYRLFNIRTKQHQTTNNAVVGKLVRIILEGEETSLITVPK